MKTNKSIKWMAGVASLTVMMSLTFSARAETIYIGDKALQGSNVTKESTKSGDNIGVLTYVLFGDGAVSNEHGALYVNNSGGDLEIKLTEVNFYSSRNTGDIVPFVALYLGSDFSNGNVSIGSNYQVVAIGDTISNPPIGSNPLPFLSSGTNPTFTLSAGSKLVAGFTVNQSNFISIMEAGDTSTVMDYLYQGISLNGLGPLTANSSFTMKRTIDFNIGFEVIPEPSALALMLTGGALLVFLRKRR